MRVVDLDRDMSDVIPTGMSPDSEFLFARMTEATLWATCADSGRRVLDVASGVGQDSIALVREGAYVIGAEPSARMTAMAEAFGSASLDEGDRKPAWVRGWADALPFEDDAFDSSFCKGAMDHFDDPESAIADRYPPGPHLPNLDYDRGECVVVSRSREGVGGVEVRLDEDGFALEGVESQEVDGPVHPLLAAGSSDDGDLRTQRHSPS
jgi:SAM-dependent methyltransferase